MRLTLIAFGRLKNPGIREAADHYKKLIRPWVQLEEVELKPLEVPDKSPATRKQIQAKEAEILAKKIQGPYYLLDEGGKARSTIEWAAICREWESTSQVTLCVGSSLGFAPEIRAKARGMISLGPQTLPHGLARVVLLEQLYRAWSVIRGHPYHNEGE